MSRPVDENFVICSRRFWGLAGKPEFSYFFCGEIVDRLLKGGVFYAGIQPRALRGVGTAVCTSGFAVCKLSNVFVAAPLLQEPSTPCGDFLFCRHREPFFEDCHGLSSTQWRSCCVDSDFARAGIQ